MQRLATIRCQYKKEAYEEDYFITTPIYTLFFNIRMFERQIDKNLYHPDAGL